MANIKGYGQEEINSLARAFALVSADYNPDINLSPLGRFDVRTQAGSRESGVQYTALTVPDSKTGAHVAVCQLPSDLVLPTPQAILGLEQRLTENAWVRINSFVTGTLGMANLPDYSLADTMEAMTTERKNVERFTNTCQYYNFENPFLDELYVLFQSRLSETAVAKVTSKEELIELATPARLELEIIYDNMKLVYG